MQRTTRWFLGALLIAGLLLAGCTQTVAPAAKEEPAKIEPVAGTEFNLVTLTEHAAQRLDIQTAPLTEEQVGGATRKVIPYAAVLYGLHGETWAYTSPAPLTYVRTPITVESIEGDKAILTDGPATGTEIVHVGVAELYGTDTGVGK
jgi:hypothetical protein